MRACNRGIPSPGTLAGDSFSPEERRLRREGAIVFCPLSSSSCLQSPEPRVAADASAPSTFLWDAVGAFDFGSVRCPVALMTWFAGGLNYAQWSYPRAQRCTQGTK